MLTRSQLITALNECRGKGRWAVLAREVECDYGTISRIARGVMAPGSILLERLSVALREKSPA
jgi:hypothetical protein